MMRVIVAFLAVAVFAFVLAPNGIEAQSACTSSVSTMSADEQAVFAMVNQFRVQNGIQALSFSSALQRAAVSHSALMAQTGVFAHDSLSATQMRLVACGENGSAIGENIAGGNIDASSTFQQWINSPEHRANMLSSSFTDTGISRVIGIYSTGGTTYNNFAMWTEEFSNGSGSTPTPAPQPQPQPQPQPGPLSITLTGPTSVAVGQPVTFTATGSGASRPLFSIAFGDGAQQSWQASPIFTHVYSAPGSYVVQAWLGDITTGQISTPARLTITVGSTPTPQPQPGPQPGNICRAAYFLNGALTQGAIIACP